MQTRSAQLTAFLNTMHSAIVERTSTQSDAYRATTRIMQALKEEREAATPEPWHRTADVKLGSPFANGHANATLIGQGGLEERDDVWVGISLMAPNIEYPEHHHAPEEVYLVMSPGHWRQDRGEWFEPGIGGLVCNTPNILHAMRSGSAPLLATWCLCKN